MNRDPILASTSYHDRVPMVFKVEGGLHYIKGNSAPHFTLTYTSHRKGFPNQCYSGGAGHEEILKRFPRFADLAALHLSDINGVPMHAATNAWYWYAGAIGDTSQSYTGATGQSGKSAAECARIFAEHVRVDTDTAAELVARHMSKSDLAAWCDEQTPRWKAEAEACITKHNLRTFGDV